MAISTTTSLENVASLLSASFGISAEGWFEVIGAGDMVSRKKPAPDIYQYVLDRCRVSAEDCVAFEDSAPGLRAAIGAGVPTVITVNDYTTGQDFDGAMLVLDCLGDRNVPANVLAPQIELGHDYLTVEKLVELHEAWVGCQQ